MKLRELLRDVTVREIAPISTSRSRASLPTRVSSLPARSSSPSPDSKPTARSSSTPRSRKGAAAIVGESSARVACQVDDARAALALIAANFYGRPADKLSLVGVTGTSGKTTTTKMIESIFDAAGEPVGLIGTIEYRAGDERLMADRTTPDAVVLQQWFAKMVDAGVRNAVMEVSSHALALKRTYGIHFAAAVFTNLSQDHFDFHKDFEDYFAAKRILFDQIDRTRKTAIVNIDDEYGRRLANELGELRRHVRPRCERRHSSARRFRDLRPRTARPRQHAARRRARRVASPRRCRISTTGSARSARRSSVGIDIADDRGGHPQPRRRCADGSSTSKPTADRRSSSTTRTSRTRWRSCCTPCAISPSGGASSLVFGCGGDRDKDKRPKMGEIAARLADYTILTSDNPRGEKPEAILDDIERGMRGATNYARITDRREAIAATIAEAADDDVIVIAGKGHEPYQVIGDQVIHFDDREEAERALKKQTRKRLLNR